MAVASLELRNVQHFAVFIGRVESEKCVENIIYTD